MWSASTAHNKTCVQVRCTGTCRVWDNLNVTKMIHANRYDSEFTPIGHSIASLEGLQWFCRRSSRHGRLSRVMALYASWAKKPLGLTNLEALPKLVSPQSPHLGPHSQTCSQLYSPTPLIFLDASFHLCVRALPDLYSRWT